MPISPLTVIIIQLTNGLDDPAQVEKELNAQLRSMGLYAANITGDGNCLFRYVAENKEDGGVELMPNAVLFPISSMDTQANTLSYEEK